MVLPRRISLQAIYFLYFGSLGSLLPFMSLIFSERGISPTDIGWLMMLIPACNLVIPPLWGVLADARQSRVPALVLALLGTATGAILLTPTWSFAQMMGVMVFFGVFRAPITALLDAVTHSHIPDSPEAFGRFRLWGSVGFLLCSALFGFLRDTLVESSSLLGTRWARLPAMRPRARHRGPQPRLRSDSSIGTESGIGILRTFLRERSSLAVLVTSSSSRLCIRISQWSHVSAPSPSGLFLQGTTIRRVGRGIGPLSFTPVSSEMAWI